jgi:hypothetical protein
MSAASHKPSDGRHEFLGLLVRSRVLSARSWRQGTPPATCALSAYPGTGAQAHVDTNFDEKVLRLAAREGVRFADYDTDGDGVVTGENLATLIINATYMTSLRGGGQTRDLTETSLGGVRVRGMASGCDEGGGLSLFAHELFHQPSRAPDHQPVARHRCKASPQTGHGCWPGSREDLLYDMKGGSLRSPPAHSCGGSLLGDVHRLSDWSGRASAWRSHSSRSTPASP